MLLEEQSPLFVLDTDYDSAMNGGRVFIDAILLIPQSPGGVTFSPFGLLTPKIEGFCILALGEKHFTTYTVFFWGRGLGLGLANINIITRHRFI